MQNDKRNEAMMEGCRSISRKSPAMEKPHIKVKYAPTGDIIVTREYFAKVPKSAQIRIHRPKEKA